ncbi:MAG: A/G-specific adenine glycosylase [Chlamydiales bacterium]|jgi:A/G-specific adenine glycosylase
MVKQAISLFATPVRARRRRLGARLEAWYGEHRRDLPWRRTRDPYSIWISEAMLQQTRVDTVVDYWTRFIDRFPDAESLARADVDQVLQLWSGLGYYRRARALHSAAVKLVEEHHGHFPRSRAELLALPGIGPYTAGAVLSIAFDLPEALVDGNVERVFARLFALDAPLDDPAFRRHCWDLARLFVVDVGSPRAWNQALMELGATVCTPRRPKCEVCPVRLSCAARASDRADELPRPKRRRASVAVSVEILVVRRGDRLLLQKRPAQGRMAGLHELPTRERPAEGVGTLTGLFPDVWPSSTASGAALLDTTADRTSLGEFRHGITHHRIRAELVAGQRLPRADLDPRFSWVPFAELDRWPLTGMARKAREQLSGWIGNLAAPE